MYETNLWFADLRSSNGQTTKVRKLCAVGLVSGWIL